MVAAVLALVACQGDPDDPYGSEIDFTSHSTNYSILVRNNTSETMDLTDLLQNTTFTSWGD
jgi:hypothetical protein